MNELARYAYNLNRHLSLLGMTTEYRFNGDVFALAHPEGTEDDHKEARAEFDRMMEAYHVRHGG